MTGAAPSDDATRSGTRASASIEAYLKNAPIGVIEWDVAYRVLRWDGAAEAIFGWRADEVLGRSIGDLNFVDPEDLSLTGEVMAKLASGRHPNVVARNRNRTRCGEVRYCEWNNTTLLDERGRLKSVLSFVVDRTSEWVAQRRLGLLSRLSDETRPLTEPSEIVDAAMRLLRDWLGADRCAWAEVEADENHFTFLGGAAASGVAQAEGRFPISAFGAEALRVMREGRAFVCCDALTELPEQADREAYVATGIRALIATPIHKRGRLVGGTGVHALSPRRWTPEEVQLARDVTDRCWENIVRARAIRDLRERESSLRVFFESANEGILRAGPDDRVLFANDTHCRVLGYEPGETVGMSVLDFVFPEDLPAASARRRERRETGKGERYEMRLRGKDGREVWVINSTIAVHRDGRYDGTYSMIADITERKRAERALLESEARERSRSEELSALLDSVPAAIWIARDPACHDVIGSRHSLEVLRLSPGANPSVTAPEGHRPTNFRVLREDGTEYPPEDLPLQAAAATGTPRRNARTVIEFDDGSRTHLLGNAEPLLDERGRPRGAVSAFVDITEIVRAREAMQRHQEELERQVRERTAELEQSLHRLRTSERMASLGTLSAGLGHDMGNILMPLRVRLETLEKLVESEQARAEVQGVRDLADYLRKLASGLRQLAVDPRHSGAGESVELRAWWDETEGVFRNALPRGVTISAALPDAPTWARVPKAALTQAVFNLVQNAGDAMAGQGKGHVTVTASHAGERVLLRVADTGPGMSEDVRRRCMEPFFTTKARGLSTGLGLALVYGLVREAGGSVDIDSAPGRGTTFVLSLPAGRPPTSPRAARRAAVRVSDARLRAYILAELRHRGYEVLESVADAPPSPDLLVVDESVKNGHASAGVVAVPSGASIAAVRSLIREFDEA